MSKSFRKLEDVKKDDQIKFTTPYGEVVYEITDFKITDTNIIVPTDYGSLTLKTYYSFEYTGAAPNRFIVYMKIVSQQDLEKQS